MADLINENKIIESALKEKDDKNRFLIGGEYKDEYNSEVTIIV